MNWIVFYHFWINFITSVIRVGLSALCKMSTDRKREKERGKRESYADGRNVHFRQCELIAVETGKEN